MPDFEDVQIRIRAMDFDQQTYDGRKNFYLPQFFKENNAMVNLVRSKLLPDSIDQYKVEERSIMAKRILSSGERINHLVEIAKKDTLSFPENVEHLKKDIFELVKDVKFKRCRSMGEILALALDFVRRNYEGVSMRQIIEKRIQL